MQELTLQLMEQIRCVWCSQNGTEGEFVVVIVTEMALKEKEE